MLNRRGIAASFAAFLSVVPIASADDQRSIGASSDGPVPVTIAEAPHLPPVVVVGTTPVPGHRTDADKVPGNVQSLSVADLSRDGTADLLGAMANQLGSVNINDTLADPFQPDILYRGFEASPVLGTPQGLAVYQNGVRVNEAFGDSVNWDLIPDIAISRIDLLSGSPLFGLNALGGALSIAMKNGFTYDGAEVELAGGSFDRRSVAAELGFHQGAIGGYAATQLLSQDGWRLFARDDVKKYYLEVGLHGDGRTVDFSYSRADNRLFGQGAAPIQSLALSPRNVFTGPQNNMNALDALALNAAVDFTQATALQTVAYFRRYRQTVSNGDSSDFTRCTSGAGLGNLCQGDSLTPLVVSSDSPIPDLTNGGTTLVGQNDFESIRSRSWGASLQLTSTARLAGHGNSFVAGATVDTSATSFFSGTQVGLLEASLTVLPSPYFVDTPESTNFSASPVSLSAKSKYYGIYATDSLDVDALSVTASGRYNVAKVDLTDRRGTALNGFNRFTHLNPSLGATYKLSAGETVYAGYSTNNRAPTPSEIECSDPPRPCLLPSSLAGDPPNLRQVIARTVEFGVRGRLAMPYGVRRLSWNAGVFRTTLDDDIYAIATSVSAGFFQNIGSTRRQGLEAGMQYTTPRWAVYAQYSFVDATFRSALTLNSSSNPFQDSAGNIEVTRGDRLPLIPRSRLKLGADCFVTPNWSVGGTLAAVSESYYRGDESNRNAPLPGFTVVNLRSSYRIGKHLEIVARVQNLFDRRYSTYGLLSDPTGVGAPGVPAAAGSNDPSVDNRFQAPGMPRAFFANVRISM